MSAAATVSFACQATGGDSSVHGAERIPESSKAITEHDATVDGLRLHYAIGGHGSAVVLIHGFGQTSHMWRPLMEELVLYHTVIAPDLRGAGGSEKPIGGYDKVTLAKDVHALVASLGFEHATVVGHDIGLMVVYAYAAQFPKATDRVVLMDAFLPGIGRWRDVWSAHDLWHFHFYGPTPLALIDGRERIYLEHFWNDFAADPNRSVPEADRRIYAAAFAQPGGVRSAFEYFRNFERDAHDFEELAKTPLTMPVLVLAGEKSGGTSLVEQTKLVATDVHGKVIAGSGHWLLEEAPARVIPAIVSFVDGGPLASAALRGLGSRTQ